MLVLVILCKEETLLYLIAHVEPRCISSRIGPCSLVQLRFILCVGNGMSIMNLPDDFFVWVCS